MDALSYTSGEILVSPDTRRSILNGIPTQQFIIITAIRAVLVLTSHSGPLLPIFPSRSLIRPALEKIFLPRRPVTAIGII